MNINKKIIMELEFTFTSNSAGKIKNKFRCKKCGKTYKTQYWFNKHRQMHKKKSTKIDRRKVSAAINRGKKRLNKFMKTRQNYMVNMPLQKVMQMGFELCSRELLKVNKE